MAFGVTIVVPNQNSLILTWHYG